MKNCMTCKHYLRCTDEDKGVLYRCDNYKKIKVADFAQTFMSANSDRDIDLPEMESIVVREFDIARSVRAVVENDDMVIPDAKVPDEDFPLAKNFFEFCTAPEYLHSKPYAWQACYGLYLMAEYCPDCSTSPEWILEGWKPKSTLLEVERNVCMLEHGKCPNCKKTKLQLRKQKKLKMFSEAALCVGQRSGKSLWFGDIAAYVTHRQIKLQNPVQLYGLKPNSSLHGTFVALTFGQAKDTLWDPLYGHLTGSPWFVAYHDMLKECSRHGDEILNLKDSFVQYKHRRLMIYPAGPDKRVLRGRTRFMGGIDELGWFPNGPEALKLVKMNADEVYKALNNSLITVQTASKELYRRGYYNVPPAYFVNISSPSSQRDKINELVSKSHGSSRIFGVIKPTWEMHPKMTYKVLANEFSHDPVALNRDFGCNPPIANSPFISEPDNVVVCSTTKRNPIRVLYKDIVGKNSTTRFAEIAKIKSSGRPCVMALDAGLANNSFAITLTSLRDGVPSLDLLVEVQPEPGIKINYSMLYSTLISPLIEKRNVVLLAADRWNSTKLLQDAERDHSVKPVTYSLKYKDMVLFKDYMEDGKYMFPEFTMTVDEILKHESSKYPKCFRHHPVEHFILQCLTVQDTGNAVLKGEGFTDDLMRSAMLGFFCSLNEEYRDLMDGPIQAVHSTVDISQSMIFKGMSNASGSVSAKTVTRSNGSALGTIRQRAG